MTTPADETPWYDDHVLLRDGLVIPVRATARRPRWEQLPHAVRAAIEVAAGSEVITTWSAGTGFTPGFASRLDLADGTRIFVKAASSADDTQHGWPISNAYREELRKLSLLSHDIGAPALQWHRELEAEGEQWIVLGFEYADATPPRRPWRAEQLRSVLDAFVEHASELAVVPPELELESLADHLLATYPERLERIGDLEGDSEWLGVVANLCAEGWEQLAGTGVVHMDLRDDNVLINDAGRVWFVDWNWPVMGPPWVDPVCILLSARGDGLDVETLVAEHPSLRDVPPRAINCLLAVLWSFWGAAKHEAVPLGSPHLRDHQRWYGDATRNWLEERLGHPRSALPRSAPPRFVRPAADTPGASRPDESDGPQFVRPAADTPGASRPDESDG